MFSIEMSIEAPDFDKHTIEIQCPYCELHTWVRLGEIRRREITICRGCHANIRLEDHMGQFQRFIRKFEKMISNFGRS